MVVTCSGIESAPHRLLSYFLPKIYDLSRSWVAHGSLLRATGAFFVDRTTMCRIEGQTFEAKVMDDSHLECKVRFSSASKLGRVGKLSKIEISNDNGKRWVSGLTFDSPVRWGGGSLVPVTPRTITYPKEVVIGGIIPTDGHSDAAQAAKYVSFVKCHVTHPRRQCTVNDCTGTVFLKAYFMHDLHGKLI